MTFEEWWATQNLPVELKDKFRLCWVKAYGYGYANGESSGEQIDF